MIKIMLKPFFKKFFGLFISMVFVSALSIAMLSAFGSTITNLQKTYKSYLNEYQNIDAVFKTSLMRKAVISDIKNVEGVESVSYRITLDSKMKKDDGRVITARLFSYLPDDDQGVFKPYIMSSTERKAGAVNVGVVRKFADNNGIKVGDTIKIGYFNIYADLYVNAIVETPEGIQARANEYVWSDNTDFGYIYVQEEEMDTLLKNLAQKLETKLEDSEYKAQYEIVKNTFGVDISDIVESYVNNETHIYEFCNQILIHAKDGVEESVIVDRVSDYLENKNINIKSKSEAHQLFYILYLQNVVKQLRVASIFLPAFFYAVTMIVIALFMNQIIKSMTKEIGIMTSIGVGFRNIQVIFIIFTLLMSIASALVGVGTAYLLNYKLVDVMRKVYSIPTIPHTLNVLISMLACVGLAVFAEATTLISTRSILKITPKDATLNNETKRKPVPKGLQKIIDKSPMTIKLGLNSIAQNFRRFFVSTFSIFASFVIILLSIYFYAAKSELVNQSVKRRLNFNAQVYLTDVASDETINNVKSQTFITSFENCLYTYLEAESSEGKKTYLECLAFDPASTTNLVQIPDKNGKKSQKLPEEGLVLPKTAAEVLKVKVGDTITINEKEVKVSAISNQYFHPITYLSLNEMKKITDQYVSSFLVNTNDEKAMLDYFSKELLNSLTVFTSNLSKDILGIFNSINIFIVIMIGFSLGMAFVILSIMGQNTLMDQKRQLTVFRAIGFRVKDISDLWTLQSLSHLIISTILALPVGIGTSLILFKLCSSTSQTYPFVFTWAGTGFAFLFILVIIVATHLISMLSIKKWNIADVTRSRE